MIHERIKCTMKCKERWSSYRTVNTSTEEDASDDAVQFLKSVKKCTLLIVL